MGSELNGGEGEIRTPGDSRLVRFQDGSLKPLGHLSVVDSEWGEHAPQARRGAYRFVGRRAGLTRTGRAGASAAGDLRRAWRADQSGAISSVRREG